MEKRYFEGLKNFECKQLDEFELKPSDAAAHEPCSFRENIVETPAGDQSKITFQETSTPAIPPKKVIIISDSRFENRTMRRPLKFDDDREEKKTTAVTVKVDWKNSSKSRNLPEDLISLGSMICRGTYKQIANAAWRHQAFRKAIVTLFLREIDKECGSLCAKTKYSMLRSTSRDEMVNFQFKSLEKEFQAEAPQFWNVMKTAAIQRKKIRNSDKAPLTLFQHAWQLQFA